MNEVVHKHIRKYGGAPTRLESFKGDFKNSKTIARINKITEGSIVTFDDLMSEMIKSEDVANIF